MEEGEVRMTDKLSVKGIDACHCVMICVSIFP